jgi:hypothetical protein
MTIWIIYALDKRYKPHPADPAEVWTEIFRGSKTECVDHLSFYMEHFGELGHFDITGSACYKIEAQQ